MRPKDYLDRMRAEDSDNLVIIEWLDDLISEYSKANLEHIKATLERMEVIVDITTTPEFIYAKNEDIRKSMESKALSESGAEERYLETETKVKILERELDMVIKLVDLIK